MQRIILDTTPSRRYEDKNGFLCIKRNPIAKAGVFEYLGESLGMTGNDAKRIYKVYRSFDELVKTAKEFEGLPIILGHRWVEGNHTNPTVMGIISGKVTAEEPYLYADIKIINDEARKVIESGEICELSPGYTGEFEEENGEYNGEEYNFKQFNIHYNHLALVDVGRSGPDLKILDKNITGGNSMQNTLKIEDVNIDKLAALLVDFFNEEKKEGVHNEDEDDDVMADVPTNDEDEDTVIVDVPSEDDDDDDIIVDIPTNNEDEDTVIVDIPSEDEDTTDIARKTVDAAIKSYKREHAKAMAAYDEVSPLVGVFKMYDSAGNTMSENTIYKFACKRLGLDKVEGITDYKSAFRAANFMQNKIGKSVVSEAKRFNDTADDDELLTVDEIIKAAFRN